MLIDSLLEFCDGVALNTGAPGTYLIGSQIDLEVVRDLGVGSPLWLYIQVHTTATSGGAATGQFILASDSTAAISTTTSTVHMVTPAFAVASMVAGTLLYASQLPLEGNAYERYLGILQTTGTAAFTAGNVDIWIADQGFKNKAYPNAVN